jgi:lysozyme
MSALSLAIERLIKPFEGCKLKAYPDPATGGDPWTIGWGATGPDVKRGTVWTQDQADNRLIVDASRFERGVLKLLTRPLAQHQMAALISFAYNCGLANLAASTLLRMVNAGQHDLAAQQFPRWNKANGKVLAGLTRRRAAERAVFEGRLDD